MKTTLTIIFALCFVLPWRIAFSQPLGNPNHLVEKGAFKVGLQGTLVSKKNFNNFTVNRVFSDGTFIAQPTDSSALEDDVFSMVFVTYGLTDRINLFVKSGMASGGSWVIGGSNPWEGELKDSFTWGTGAQGSIFQIGDGWDIGLGVQYLRYDNRGIDNWKETDTDTTAEALGWKTNDEIDYWQVDVVASLSRNMGSFTPYIGIGYDYSNIHVTGNWVNSTSFTSYKDDGSFSNENKASVLAGFDAEIGNNFTANLQGTFVSSTAVTLGISYKF